MAKIKPTPNRIFKVRDPDTGLFLGKKPSASKWTDSSWNAVGAIHPTHAKAVEMIEHYVLNTADRTTPLEVVELQIMEVAVTPVPLPPLDPGRTFIQTERSHWHAARPHRLWYGLSPNTISGFALRRLIDGTPPKYIAWLEGTPNPIKTLNLKGERMTCSVHGKKRTYLALDDDSSMVALKLAHFDKIVQLWNFDGTLMEGEEYAT